MRKFLALPFATEVLVDDREKLLAALNTHTTSAEAVRNVISAASAGLASIAVMVALLAILAGGDEPARDLRVIFICLIAILGVLTLILIFASALGAVSEGKAKEAEMRLTTLPPSSSV